VDFPTVKSAFAEQQMREAHTLDLASATKTAMTIMTKKAYNPA
jgi:hypothetical protein